MKNSGHEFLSETPEADLQPGGVPVCNFMSSIMAVMLTYSTRIIDASVQTVVRLACQKAIWLWP